LGDPVPAAVAGAGALGRPRDNSEGIGVARSARRAVRLSDIVVAVSVPTITGPTGETAVVVPVIHDANACAISRATTFSISVQT